MDRTHEDADRNARTTERTQARDRYKPRGHYNQGICKGCGLVVEVDLPPTEHSITISVGGHRVAERCGPVKVFDRPLT